MTNLQQEATRIINKMTEENLAEVMPLLRDVDKKRREESKKEFSRRLDEAAAWAAAVGYQESDVAEAIRKVRARKRELVK